MTVKSYVKKIPQFDKKELVLCGFFFHYLVAAAAYVYSFVQAVD